jgi:hypothetical protein
MHVVSGRDKLFINDHEVVCTIGYTSSERIRGKNIMTGRGNLEIF